jgi:hypothetical protein
MMMMIFQLTFISKILCHAVMLTLLLYIHQPKDPPCLRSFLYFLVTCIADIGAQDYSISKVLNCTGLGDQDVIPMRDKGCSLVPAQPPV